MNSTIQYINNWQKALQQEIIHLKKFGSTKYLVYNGHFVAYDKAYTYYFETNEQLRIPVGSTIQLEWSRTKYEGRILSSEGGGVIIALEKTLGDIISEAYILYDPWELLEQLSMRLDEVKKSKQKRIRVKRLMNPSMDVKHPHLVFKSASHELRIRSKYNPVTFVWGPPGTGKTYTLARTAASHYFKNKKILLLSHSNQAVDVLISEMTRFVKKKKRFKEGDILRYGTQTGDTLKQHREIFIDTFIEEQNPDLARDKDELLKERQQIKKDLTLSFSKRDSNALLEIESKITKVYEKIRQQELKYVKEAFVIGATLAKAASDPAIYENKFDLIIIDEASMAYVPQAAYAASLGKHSIICGDFKQLPPIASSRHPLVEQWLKEDIFHRAGVADKVEKGELHPHLFMLQEQRRMHPDISAFTNQYIYHSLVGDHESVRESRKELAEREPFSKKASILLDACNAGEFCIKPINSNSKINLWQLLLSFQVLHESYQGGSRSLGYVTPYRAQAALMEKLVFEIYENDPRNTDIISATVHRFQGSERDVMVFDAVDGFPDARPGMLLTGKDSERLINVAITRTRGKFIHVTDTSYIQSHIYPSKTIRKLADFQNQRNQNIEMDQIGRWIKHQHPKLQWMHAGNPASLLKDCSSARKTIFISIPSGASIPESWIRYLQENKSSADITIFSKKQPPLNAPFDHWEEGELPFPFLIIDQEILWLGILMNGLQKLKPPYVSVRLQAPVFIREMMKLLVKA